VQAQISPTYWLKVVATTLNLPVDIPAEGDFGAAFGAARLGLIAAEKADPFVVCRPPHTEHTIEPDTALVDAFEAAYQNYKKHYPAIKGVQA
jgi:xylulokinase